MFNCGALVAGDETVTHSEWHELIATAAADGRHGRAAFEEMRRLQVGRLEEEDHPAGAAVAIDVVVFVVTIALWFLVGVVSYRRPRRVAPPQRL